jgi:hypothetical protein
MAACVVQFWQNLGPGPFPQKILNLGKSDAKVRIRPTWKLVFCQSVDQAFVPKARQKVTLHDTGGVICQLCISAMFIAFGFWHFQRRKIPQWRSSESLEFCFLLLALGGFGVRVQLPTPHFGEAKVLLFLARNGLLNA